MSNPAKSLRNKLLSGTYRPDRVTNIAADGRLARCPAPPGTLSRGAQAEWKRIAPIAHSLGTLTRCDLRAFEMLCECLSSERLARAIVDKDGLTVDGKAHPLIKSMETARNQAGRLFSEFGLTPKSRANVSIAPPPKRNEFDDV